MPLFTKKLDTGQIRTIKWVLEFGFAVLFIVFGFFGVFSDVFSATIFEDSFETYNLGDLNNQGGWVVENGTDVVLVENYETKTGEQAIVFDDLGNDYGCFKVGTGFSTGTIGFWIKSRTLAGTNNTFQMKLKSNGYTIAEILWKSDKTITANQEEIQGFGTYENDIWYSVDIEWVSETKLVRYNWNNEGWTGWIGNPANATAFPNAIKFFFHSNFQINKWYVDYIAETSELGCSLENCSLCESNFSCSNAGCCWYYSTWLQEWFCVPCSTGECENSILGCQYCLIQGTCEAQENCYWFNGLCKFGTGECGTGLNCQLCLNQTNCEAQDCYWYENFCWISEPVEISSWFDYYAEHGDYATSSVFVNQMASTTGIVFNTLGGFLVGFVGIFDVQEAIAQGKNFGSVIPIARGHLGIINSFFGELPISQAFLFLITFLVAVGTFRLVRNIFNLVKFW